MYLRWRGLAGLVILNVEKLDEWQLAHLNWHLQPKLETITKRGSEINNFTLKSAPFSQRSKNSHALRCEVNFPDLESYA